MASRKGYPKTDMSSQNARKKIFYPNGDTLEVNDAAPYVGMYRDCVGVNSPNWPQEKPVNNFLGYRSRCHNSPYSVVEIFPSGIRTVGTEAMPFSASDPAMSWDSSKVMSTVLYKLARRVKDQKANLALAAAQFRKTCGTVSDVASRIASAIRDTKRGDLGGAVGTLLGGRRGGGGSDSGGGRGGKKPRVPPNSGSVASDWLAIQYGWKPLLSDVYGACEELARVVTYREPAKTITASASSTSPFSEVLTWQNGSGSGPVYLSRGSLSVSVKAHIEYSVGSQLAQTAASTGVSNPYALAWELLPWSFVADWFIPVGAYLESFDYDNGLEFLRGWINVKSTGIRTTRTVAGVYNQIFGQVQRIISGGSSTIQVEMFERQALGAFPTVPPPRFKDPRSLSHALNAIALVRVQAGR